ncbi:MAG: hypothetical protein EBZ49_00400 [Proteobacteria bacterium]|nr:hypothetical protein [Pseudomonadota bacterium]
MTYEQLSAEDQALLDTQFPAELEKEAAAELQQAQELYSIGFEKLAVEAADTLDKLAEEKEEEEEKEEKPELSEEHKKEAAARASFIARAYCDGLMKLGQERHGNELHYFIPAIDEKIAGWKEWPRQAWESTKGMASKGVGKAKELGGKLKDKTKGHGEKAKEMVEKHPHRYAAGAFTGGALVGSYAHHKMTKKKDKKK